MDEADLKNLVRAFRASVTEDQAAIHRQMTDLATEVRQRIATFETAVLNGLRDLSQRTDRRFTLVEQGLAEVKQDVAEVKQDVAQVKHDVADLREAVGRIEAMLSR